jgi:hypothetical protein
MASIIDGHSLNVGIFCFGNVLKSSESHSTTKWENIFVCLMVFNATFNNISVISWQSVLLMEEIGGPGENH